MLVEGPEAIGFKHREVIFFKPLEYGQGDTRVSLRHIFVEALQELNICHGSIIRHNPVGGFPHLFIIPQSLEYFNKKNAKGLAVFYFKNSGS
jgi:hypothetical protein